MKHIFCIFLLVGCFHVLSAQSAEEDVVRLKSSVAAEAVVASEASVSAEAAGDAAGEEKAAGAAGLTAGEKAPERKAHLGMSVGTSFTYMPGYGSYMGFSAMPTYTLPLNDRWSLHAGLIASRYTGLNVPVYEGLHAGNGFSNLSVFAAASYKMTDNLIIHGAGVKSLVSGPMPPLMSYPSDQFSLGATYKFGDNFSIGATIQMNRGHSGYGSYYSPFGW